MTPRLVILLALAACLQFAAVVFLHWPGSGRESASAAVDARLLSLEREDITRISVTDASGREITVERQDSQWRIEQAALPAATVVIERLLDALTRPTGFPVARSDSARERFQVDAARFQRRITLVGGGEQAQSSKQTETTDRTTVYLGTSPGLRQVYARRSDSQAIQAITLSTFDVPATVDGWLEPSLLALQTIDRVRVDDGEWIKSGSSWIVTSPQTASGEPPLQALEALGALEQILRTLQVTGLAAVLDADARTHTVTQDIVIGHANQEIKLRLAKATAGSEARIYRSDLGHGFTLSRYDHDRLADAVNALKPEVAE